MDSQKALPKLFISYAFDDQPIARVIVERLRARGVGVWFDQFELQPGDSIAEMVRDAVRSSDYILVLLSPRSVGSKWVQYELSTAYTLDLEARGIGVLPVIVEHCPIPPLLAQRQWIDLSVDFDAAVDRLSEWIRGIPMVDFSQLNSHLFEGLVADLLRQLGFGMVQQEVAIQDAEGLIFEFDIKAEREITDPFGDVRSETWLVETKFYRKERASVAMLDQLLAHARRLPAQGSHLLLVTDSQLTPSARNWLTHRNSPSNITVIEGPQLKRLVLSHEQLVEKYFASRLP
jgi:hypothetical protein